MSPNDQETPEILQRIVASTTEELRARKEAVPLGELEEAIEPRTAGRFIDPLRAPEISLIAEHKRKSPSKGPIRPGSSVAEVFKEYEDSGVVTNGSVLTSSHFDGSLADLEEARHVTDMGLLRKDFTIDEYQLYEAAKSEADAVLFILSILSDKRLKQLDDEATDLGLDRLVEVHNLEELVRALEAIDPDMIGINNRNLHDFSEDIETTYGLLDEIPAGKTVVSESAIRDRQTVIELEEANVNAVLIGEALMRADDPGAKAAELMSS